MIVKCPACGAYWEVEENDPDVVLEPFPHILCNCGEMIPLY